MKKPVIILLHVGYWLSFAFLLSMFYGLITPMVKLSGAPNMFHWWTRILLTFAIIPGVVSFYGVYSFAFRKYLSRRRVGAFIIALLIICVAGTLASDLFLALTTHGKAFSAGFEVFIEVSIVIGYVALMNALIGLVMRGFIDWYSDIKVKEQLQQKNYEVELALLKAQINPHFLFNTINNIDVLIAKDAAKASEYLNKLSDIMRFMLYDTNTESIKLEDELAYIEKYISLQRIRTTNPDFVDYNVKGQPGAQRIAPMLFIPFIENAFKYAENKKVNGAVYISIIIEPDRIIFECENHFDKDTRQKTERNGLGNDLIRKRLQLLYPSLYTLNITEQNQIYKVKLILNGR